MFLPPLLVALAHAGSQPELKLRLPDYSLVSRSYCLPSGIRITFQEDHTQPVVAISSVVDQGSSGDPPGQEGMAHLVEHLWFRSHLPELPTVWNMLGEMGASLNAATFQSVTTYMTVAPRAMLPALLRLEAERLRDPLAGVTQEIVDTEREIVRNELRSREAWDVGAASIFGQLYPEGHPYARLFRDSHRTLAEVPLADLQAFTQEHYPPANTTIMVVGDFTLDESGKLLTEAFPIELLADPENPDKPIESGTCPVRIAGPSDPPPDPPDQALVRVEASTAW